jgi:hypothetical protein
MAMTNETLVETYEIADAVHPLTLRFQARREAWLSLRDMT